MKLNYILLPENHQPRPRSGYRRLPKKAYEAFTPMSRAGRRVPGKTKVKMAMTNDGKEEEEEERHGSRLFRFIKELNNNLTARFTYAGKKPTSVNAAPVLVTMNDQDGSRYLSSRVRQKRSTANDDKSSMLKAKNERVSKRSRYNPMASSSRSRVEDVPRVRNSTDLVGTAVYTFGNNQQRFTGEQNHHHAFPLNPNPVKSHPPFPLYAVRDTNPPIFPDHAVLHQPGQPLWLDARHAHHGFPLYNGDNMRNYDLELEHVAIGCAYSGMDDEPMDVDPEFPIIIPDNELNLERLAIECAYAGLDEAMDTALDDTRGPIYDFVRQEQPVFDAPGFYFPPRQPTFHTIQAQEHGYFVDQDERLQPPMHAYPMDQQFRFHQGDFVMNQNFPHQPLFEPNHYPVEGHAQIAPPFDMDHGIHHYANVHIPLPHVVHEEPNDREFVPHPPTHEVVNQIYVPHLVDEIAGRNEGILYETVVEAGERGEVFLGGDEAGEGDHVELFAELFGADGNEDDDNEEEELEIII